MQTNLNVLMAQINPVVGDIEFNLKIMINVIENKQATHDVIIFPELSLTGYPPEDLLLRKEFQQRVDESLQIIQAATKGCHTIVGHPTMDNSHCYNSLSVFHNGQRVHLYHKQHLPNYGVFDEARYFKAGSKNPCLFDIKNQRIGVCICEDLWLPGPANDLINLGASILISINASPFDYDKYYRREEVLKQHAQKGVAIIYVNQVGGQDELLFDGLSLAIDKEGTLCARSPAFEEHLATVSINSLWKRLAVSNYQWL